MALHHHSESPEISGLLYKKRGGFGKIWPNAWQHRLFVISKDGILSYYETEVSEGKDIFDNKERGRIDLKAMRYTVTEEVHEGSPSNFPITICPEFEEKWKLCAETRDNQQRWLQVLEKYQHINMHKADSRKSQVYAHHSDDEGDATAVTGAGAVITHSRSGSTGGVEYAATAAATTGTRSGVPITPRSKQQPPTAAMDATNISSNTSHQPAGRETPRKSTSFFPSAATSAAAADAVSKRPSLARAMTRKRGLKVSRSDAPILPVEWIEFIMVLLIANLCTYGTVKAEEIIERVIYIVIMNAVIMHTLYLRDFRFKSLQQAHQQKLDAHQDTINELGAAGRALSRRLSKSDVAHSGTAAALAGGATAATTTATAAAALLLAASDQHDDDYDEEGGQHHTSHIGASGKPKAGFTTKEVLTEPRSSPDHTWCKADHRLFQVRVGPDYSRFKKKAPTAPPLYTPFAADVFCAKNRVDHATQRFELPEQYTNVDTHHPFVPPVFVIQVQIPSEPPSSFFSTAEDGPGWALLMYYRITEDTLNQLKDLDTASPAVKLFAQWCEKSTEDPAWRGRFKVICYCANFVELGFPSAITSYNAKPVLIRRTGTIFRGDRHMEMDIHVHKFANLAKQSIHMLSSRCGQMYIQIGFVIEGRENSELPETLFAAIAANKPQEERAEFIFDDVS